MALIQTTDSANHSLAPVSIPLILVVTSVVVDRLRPFTIDNLFRFTLWVDAFKVWWDLIADSNMQIFDSQYNNAEIPDCALLFREFILLHMIEFLDKKNMRLIGQFSRCVLFLILWVACVSDVIKTIHPSIAEDKLEEDRGRWVHLMCVKMMWMNSGGKC